MKPDTYKMLANVSVKNYIEEQLEKIKHVKTSQFFL